jgi:hypothetical protein
VSGAKENAALIGAGAAACAVCCAGPILGLIAALGIGAIAGALLFGAGGLAIAAGAAVVLVARRRRRVACLPSSLDQPVTMSAARSRHS